MKSVSIKTMSGGEATLSDDVVASLRSSLHAGLLADGAPEYDKARSIWNAMIDRRPALIARCANTQDVVRVVRFARTHQLLVSVRGGGHSIAGNAVCEGGMMIDLSPMNAVVVDPESKTARVGPGATLGDFDRAAQVHALATPLGVNSTTGVAGLTLGGGFGWLSRSLGLTIDNLASAEVVLASGEVRTASATENPDLFWGIRGGGGNLGIVTSFEFRLHPIGPKVLAGLVVHPLDAAPEVLRSYRDFVRSAPDEFACWLVMRLAPPLPFLPVEWHGKGVLVLAMCYAGSIADGERVAAPLRAVGSPLADIVSPMPYTDWQAILDPLLAPGQRNYWKTHDFLDLPDGLINVFVEHARMIPDPQTEIAFAQLGGAVSRVPGNATAYAHRDAQFVVNVHGRWSDPANDGACIGWARSLFTAAAPFATGGAYVNFMTQEEHERVRAAYGGNFERMVELKRLYDPENFLRFNQNIRLTAREGTPAASPTA